MQTRDSLLTSLRDCTAGWVGATVAFSISSGWVYPQATDLSSLFTASALIGVVVLLIAFPISVFCRRHLPSDHPGTNSMILGLVGLLLSQLIVILAMTVPMALLGRTPPSLGEIYSAGNAPLLWAAAAAGGITGHMAGVGSRRRERSAEGFAGRKGKAA